MNDKMKKKIDLIYNASRINDKYRDMVEAHKKWEMSDMELIMNHWEVYANAFRKSFGNLSKSWYNDTCKNSWNT